MNPFSKFYLGDAIALLAANVLLQIAVVVALACAVSLLFARHRAAARHAIWLGALACVLLSPLAAYLAARAERPLISLRLLPQSTAGDAEAIPSKAFAAADVEGPLSQLPSPFGRGTGREGMGGEELAPFSAALVNTEQASQLPSPIVGAEKPAMVLADANGPHPNPLPMGEGTEVARSAHPNPFPRGEGTETADPWRAALGLAGVLWAAGAIVLLVRLIHGCWSIACLRRRLRPIDGERLAILTDVRRALNAPPKKALPPLAILPRATDLPGPITIGLFRPLVVLPEKLLGSLDAQGLRDVLVHEFAHALRRDPLVGFVQRLAAIVYWPYPPVHFLNRRLAWAREEVCDNYVLGQGDATSYAETLLVISQSFFSKPPRPVAVGLFHPYGRLEQRVADLLDPRRNVMVRMHRAALVVLAVMFSAAVIVVACTRLLHAEPPAVPADPKPAAEKRANGTSSARYWDVAKLDYSGQSLGGDGSILRPTGYTVATVSGENSATTKVAVSFAREQTEQDTGTLRVVAMDAQNKLHEPIDQNSVMGGGTKTRVVTIVAEFSLPKKDIVTLVVQQSGEPKSPRERGMVSLPAYRVEPPDVLAVEMLKMAPRPPYRIKTFDVLQIRASGGLPPPNDIDGFFLVEAEGIVNLGPAYGRVNVTGMTVEQAMKAIRKKLRKDFSMSDVSVQLAKTAVSSQVTGQYLIGPDGTINLRQYGTLHVAGMTVAEVRKALNKHLEQFFDSPDASVEVGKFNSRVYYLITEGTGVGSNIRRVPITGNDTVLDALSTVNSFWHVTEAKIWIARPVSDGRGHEAMQMLTVDYDAITRRASAATNYQIMPGDRVFIVTKPDPKATPAMPGSPATAIAAAVERRVVNKPVKDFPEKVDLSTPESALAAYERACARADAKGVVELGWYATSPRELDQLDRFLKNDSKAAGYRDILLNVQIVEVLTYHDDFAEVISTLKVPEAAGKFAVANPVSSRSFGRIKGQWKNLGEDRLPSVQAARDRFNETKELRWPRFTELRDDVIAGRTVPAHRVNAPGGGYYAFGPVIERTLAEDDKNQLLNLATGEIFDPAKAKNLSPPPDRSKEADIGYLKAFAARIKIDLVLRHV